MAPQKDEREQFLGKYQTKLFKQYGSVMKEYVEVPDDLLWKTEELKKYFEISYAYVSSLKPNPTKKKRNDRACKHQVFNSVE